MIWRAAALGFALSALITAAFPAHAADVRRGMQLAGQWCASCHVVGAAAPPPGSVQQGPPSFRAIAEAGPRGDQLRAFLAHPHGAMPDFALARSEIDDLIAYIDTLR
jgi:mono/diheme cytochrome c family protein